MTMMVMIRTMKCCGWCENEEDEKMMTNTPNQVADPPKAKPLSPKPLGWSCLKLCAARPTTSSWLRSEQQTLVLVVCGFRLSLDFREFWGLSSCLWSLGGI